MKVGHCVRAVFPQHGYGGLERAASALTRHLLLRGVDVALFTRALPEGRPLRADEGSLRGRLTVHPVRYGRLPLPPNGIPARLTNYRLFVEQMGLRVEAMARKEMLDAVYAQGLCTWGVRDVGRWGVPVVANPQGMEEFKVRDPLKRLAYTPFRAWVRAGCRAADRVIATDHSMKGELVALLGVQPERVVVIPNGVDPVQIRAMEDSSRQAALMERWPYLHASGTLKGISVGRLEENKGFEYLLQALGRSRAALGDGWGWVLVGDGSQRSRLEALVAELRLGRHVSLPGSLSDVELHNLYSLSDLFVHPTLFEGSSLVTLEAMLHGLPVVASAVGGIPDKVVEGETGMPVQPGDVEQLAEAITWMAQHPEERRLMGANGARKAAEFSWEHIAAQTERLLLELQAARNACEVRNLSVSD